MNMEENPTWLEIHYECGKVAVMEWDEYDHFIGVLENTPLDEHEITEIIEVGESSGSGLPIESQIRSFGELRTGVEVKKIWWSRKDLEAKV